MNYHIYYIKKDTVHLVSRSKSFLELYGPTLQVSVLSYIQHTFHYAPPPRKPTPVPELVDI